MKAILSIMLAMAFINIATPDMNIKEEAKNMFLETVNVASQVDNREITVALQRYAIEKGDVPKGDIQDVCIALVSANYMKTCNIKSVSGKTYNYTRTGGGQFNLE